MKTAAASSTSLVVIPGRTNSLTRSRMSLAVRQAWRIFSTSFALLIGIMLLLGPCLLLAARYRQTPLHDHDCRRCDAKSTSFRKRKRAAASSFQIQRAVFAVQPDHRPPAALAARRNKDIPVVRQTERSIRWW